MIPLAHTLDSVLLRHHHARKQIGSNIPRYRLLLFLVPFNGPVLGADTCDTANPRIEFILREFIVRVVDWAFWPLLEAAVGRGAARKRWVE